MALRPLWRWVFACERRGQPVPSGRSSGLWEELPGIVRSRRLQTPSSGNRRLQGRQDEAARLKLADIGPRYSDDRPPRTERQTDEILAARLPILVPLADRPRVDGEVLRQVFSARPASLVGPALGQNLPLRLFHVLSRSEYRPVKGQYLNSYNLVSSSLALPSGSIIFSACDLPPAPRWSPKRRPGERIVVSRRIARIPASRSVSPAVRHLRGVPQGGDMLVFGRAAGPY